MLSQKLVQRNGELADSLAGRMIDSIRNGCRGARYADLPDSSRAVGRLLVGDIQEQNFNIWNIAVTQSR